MVTARFRKKYLKMFTRKKQQQQYVDLAYI